MGETVVVNLRREPYDVYIGRARHGQDGYFGNPHPVDRPCPLCGGTVHRRGEAVAAFKRTFWKRVNSEPAYRERMQTLRGKRLGCFCKPEACHGDVITAWLDAGCPLKAGIPPAAAPAPTATPPPPVVIREFRGLYGFLSNFWPSPVIWQGVLYPSVEHAYQAAKTDDPAWIARIAAAATPAEAKRLGGRLPVRQTWNRERLAVMEALLRQKFAHPDLRAQLLATGDVQLYEGNAWGDRFWGVDLRTGEGRNILGRLLMQIRNDLRQPRPLPQSPGTTPQE